MPYESVLKPAILEKAIVLFGDGGYEGVTTQALAKAAGVNEASIFTHFDSKEGLYRRALTEITGDAEQAMGKALLSIFEERKNQDLRQFASEALRLWYWSLSQPAARFLQQALIANPEHRDSAYNPIARIINMVTASLEGKTRQRSPSHAGESVAILVSALFQYKIMRPETVLEKEETERVNARIAHWLDDLLPEK